MSRVPSEQWPDEPGGDDRRGVIVNPLSGERIAIKTAVGTADVLAWELTLEPGGAVPSAHRHPASQETFTVTEGLVRFRLRGRSLEAGPGVTVVVPAGSRHHFANAGPGTARVQVATFPAGRMEDMVRAAAAMAAEQAAARRRLPRPAALVAFMHEFDAEVGSPYFPNLTRVAVRAVATILAVTARAGGHAQRRPRRR
jgi:quercetin dioxygenase-like cupin family protein